MVGVVGIGSMPRHFLEKVLYWRGRLVPIELNYIYVYPEFFDDKKLLLSGRWAEYRVKLLNTVRDHVVFTAVYPDRLCRWINFPWEIKYVYPIHDLDRDFYCMDKLEKHVLFMYAGYPGGEYPIARYCKQVLMERGISID